MRGATFLRGTSDAGEQIVGVTGFEDAAIVAFGADPSGTLIDEPSPTTLDVGRLLTGFLLGGVLVGLAVVVLTRPLQRRLGPALPPDAGTGEDAG